MARLTGLPLRTIANQAQMVRTENLMLKVRGTAHAWHMHGTSWHMHGTCMVRPYTESLMLKAATTLELALPLGRLPAAVAWPQSQACTRMHTLTREPLHTCTRDREYVYTCTSMSVLALSHCSPLATAHP